MRSRWIIFSLLAATAVTLTNHYVQSRWSARHTYTYADMNILGRFKIDLTNGSIDDVPARFRRLDGRKVRLEGFMLSDNATPRVAHFDLVYNVGDSWGHPPPAQARVSVTVPNGTTVPYVDTYLQIFGTLHVRIMREGGQIVSVYQLDPERYMQEPTEPAALITLNRLAAFVWIAPFALALATLYKWLVNYRSHKPGTCPRCGYDLRASSARCPECGSSAGFAHAPGFGMRQHGGIRGT
jgi:hypothetical protein